MDKKLDTPSTLIGYILHTYIILLQGTLIRYTPPIME